MFRLPPLNVIFMRAPVMATEGARCSNSTDCNKTSYNGACIHESKMNDTHTDDTGQAFVSDLTAVAVFTAVLIFMGMSYTCLLYTSRCV